MNIEKQDRPHNNQINANIQNLLPKKSIKIFFQLSTTVYILFTRTETVTVFGSA